MMTVTTIQSQGLSSFFFFLIFGQRREHSRNIIHGLKFNFSELKSSHPCIRMTCIIHRNKHTHIHTHSSHSLIIYYCLPAFFVEWHNSKFIPGDFHRRLAVLRLQNMRPHTLRDSNFIPYRVLCSHFCSTKFKNYDWNKSGTTYFHYFPHLLLSFAL